MNPKTPQEKLRSLALSRTPGDLAMLGVVTLVGITTLMGAETAHIRWIGMALLTAAALTGGLYLQRRAWRRPEPTGWFQTAFNTLTNAGMLGTLALMIGVLILRTGG